MACTLGIDLGTTNSAAALFDGETLVMVRNASGANLTPSVVRIDGSGRVTVGERARRLLERDPDNTHAEFKRLMGTEERLSFPASGEARAPHELAAEVLKAIREDVREQTGILPTQAVISVPALFELPQASATSTAASLAGFEKVELIQEPIASALAAGWTEDSEGNWLVYDMGGGTFDVSLLETRDGFLRVVGHDGDNFLGGRDIDSAIVDWASARIAEGDGPAPSPRTLRRAAEEAKILLSRSREADLILPEHDDLMLDRDTLVDLAQPVVQRSLDVCRRLLEAHGVDSVSQVVLVGGPTAMPALRKAVAAGLNAPLAEGHDPMSLVARGAALYAVTAGLDLGGTQPPEAEVPGGRSFWLQFPAMSSDLAPHVVGRLLPGSPPHPVSVRLRQAADDWGSPWTDLDEDGTFVVQVQLVPRRPTVFRLQARDARGEGVVLQREELTIVHGLTVTDPPLSRSVGVALANDTVRRFFKKGAALPARRTLVLHTVDSVPQGSTGAVLRIPVVQGEFENAHLCRLVGMVEIVGQTLTADVPAGSQVEITLELDRGGRLSASALLPATQQAFAEVVHLLVPLAEPEAMAASIADARVRLEALRSYAFAGGDSDWITRLGYVEQTLRATERDVQAATGGDVDAGQKARRTLLEVDAQLESLETAQRWPEVDDEARRAVAWASGWVSERGTPTEQTIFAEAAEGVQAAREARDPVELRRHLQLVRDLGSTAFNRHPESLRWRLQGAISEIARATDPRQARSLADEGLRALSAGEEGRVRDILSALYRLLPADAATRHLGHDSGVQ